MSVELVKSNSESGTPSIRITRTPGRRGPGSPKKSIALKLWDLLQPLARLWGLITAVGKYLLIYHTQIRYLMFSSR